MTTCRQCNFCIVHKNGKIACVRRELEGITYELNIETIDIPCYARDSERYILEKEYIEPDKQVDLGYLDDILLEDKLRNNNKKIIGIWDIIN